MLYWKLLLPMTKPGQATAQLAKWRHMNARVHQLPTEAYELLVPVGRRPQAVLTLLHRHDPGAEWEQVELVDAQPPENFIGE